jgi:hypothetical protein
MADCGWRGYCNTGLNNDAKNAVSSSSRIERIIMYFIPFNDLV